MLQQFIVGSDPRRDFRLHGGQIVEFVDHGDIQVCHAGLTVAAVGALSPVGMKGGVGKHGGVVFFLRGSGLVCQGRIHLCFRVIAALDGTDCGSGEGIVDALHRRQADAKRRTSGIKEATAGEAFHDGDPNVIFLA